MSDMYGLQQLAVLEQKAPGNVLVYCLIYSYSSLGVYFSMFISPSWPSSSLACLLAQAFSRSLGRCLAYLAIKVAADEIARVTMLWYGIELKNATLLCVLMSIFVLDWTRLDWTTEVVGQK